MAEGETGHAGSMCWYEITTRVWKHIKSVKKIYEQKQTEEEIATLQNAW